MKISLSSQWRGRSWDASHSSGEVAADANSRSGEFGRVALWTSSVVYRYSRVGLCVASSLALYSWNARQIWKLSRFAGNVGLATGGSADVPSLCGCDGRELCHEAQGNRSAEPVVAEGGKRRKKAVNTWPP